MSHHITKENSGEIYLLKNPSVMEYNFILHLLKGNLKGWKKMFLTTKRAMSLQDSEIEKQSVSYLFFFLFKALAFYPSCRQLDIFVLDRFFEKDIVD